MRSTPGSNARCRTRAWSSPSCGRFADYDPNEAITLTTPATARSADHGGKLPHRRRGARFVVQQPRPDPRRRDKPEIAAPGEVIESSGAGARADNGLPLRAAMEGTNIAAPHVTGVVARLLGRQHDLRAERIRELLVKSAIRPGGIGLGPQPGATARWMPKRR